MAQIGQMAPPATDVVTGYETLQFHSGGFLELQPLEEVIHLVRRTGRGTPGPTLCGIGRFENDTSAFAEYVRVNFADRGWSVGGGVSGPRYDFKPCAECVAAIDPELPVKGSTFGPLFVGVGGANG